MFNLYQIVTGAQGGQALDNLAAQFGVTREEADKAVQSLVPALSTAFMTKAAQPGGVQELAASLDDDGHKRSYADPGTAQDPAVQQKGEDVASSIFGSNAILDQVVEQAATYTGLPAATIRQMLPVVVSMVVGGVATAMHNQGLGSVLGQLAGGLGGLFGQAGGVAGQAGGGGFGGLFGDIIGSVVGDQHASPQQPVQGVPPAGPHAPDAEPGREAASPGGPEAGLPPTIQAGLEALQKMLQPGVKAPPGAPADLDAQIGSILGGKRP